MSGGGGGDGDDEVAVFVDTNLGTRVAFSAHHHITAAALKRDFERVHFTCLPDTGEIQVNGLMVKRKSRFYYLPDTLPVKYAFPGMRRTWFLHVEVTCSKCLRIPCLPRDARTCNSEDEARCNREEKRTEGFHENYTQNAASGMPKEDKSTGTADKSRYLMLEIQVGNPDSLRANSMQGSLSKTSTQVISVTGIINKYFPGSNGIDNVSSSSNSDVTSKVVHSKIEVQSKARAQSCSKRRKIDSLPRFTAKTPPHVFHAPSCVNSVSGKSGDKSSRSKVGKRLLVASRGLAVSPIKRSPTLSFCKFKDRNQLEYKSRISGSIFSISDSDD